MTHPPHPESSDANGGAAQGPAAQPAPTTSGQPAQTPSGQPQAGPSQGGQPGAGQAVPGQQGYGQAAPGAYGQPMPGGYGQPVPGAYGQPTPGAYAQPAPGSYGQPAPQPGYGPAVGAPQQPAYPIYVQPGYVQQSYGAAPYGQGAPYAPGQPYFAGQLPPAGAGGPFDGAVNPDDLTRPLYSATFLQAVKRFFRSYARFSGRASRSEYWWVMLFWTIITYGPIFIVGMLSAVLERRSSDTRYDTGTLDSYYSGATVVAPNPLIPSFTDSLVNILGLLLLALVFGLIVPTLAITWRRLHDANYAGPMTLLVLVPYVGGLILLVFTLLSPNPAGRRFDPPRM